MTKKLYSTEDFLSDSFLPELQSATGTCDFPMSNDYIFRAVLQTNHLALKGLISALLHIPPKDIASVVITNPIILGGSYINKEYRLDINTVLNNHALINLEMQMKWQAAWKERSLIYLCRNFDNLSKGEEYSEIKPAMYIGILDKAPLQDGKEFYSECKVMNVKTHKILSDKFSLRVLRLDCIDNATAEDKSWKIDRWARLFRATTWEELMTIAEHDKYLTSAANSVYLMNADEMARKRARDREDYYRDIRTWQRQIEGQKETLVELEKECIILKDKKAALENKNSVLENKNAALENKNSALENKNSALENKNSALENQNSALENKNSVLENKNSALENKNSALENANTALENANSALQDENAELRARLAKYESQQ